MRALELCQLFDMQRILSVEASRCGSGGNEFVSKRSCFSLTLTVAFGALVAGMQPITPCITIDSPYGTLSTGHNFVAMYTSMYSYVLLFILKNIMNILSELRDILKFSGFLLGKDATERALEIKLRDCANQNAKNSFYEVINNITFLTTNINNNLNVVKLDAANFSEVYEKLSCDRTKMPEGFPKSGDLNNEAKLILNGHLLYLSDCLLNISGYLGSRNTK